jgi:hypothetical protein
VTFPIAVWGWRTKIQPEDTLQDRNVLDAERVILLSPSYVFFQRVNCTSAGIASLVQINSKSLVNLSSSANAAEPMN